MLEQGQKHMGQHFVRAIADKHLLGGHAIVGGHGQFQAVAVGVGVQAQMVAGFGGNGLQRLGRGAVGFSLVLSLTRSGSLGCSPGT